jgi:DNA polymerase-3 subunit gamma/tau
MAYEVTATRKRPQTFDEMVGQDFVVATTGTPCGTCAACREIAQGNSLDVLEIDGASNTSVNDVRQIKDEVLFAPNSSRYKIYIIDEVHMLSNSAFNALLKTIEEPPPYIVFVFATTEVHKVPATIRSRCQQFNFRLIGPEQIKARLQEVVQELKLPAEEAALFWMAREATGSLRDAYTLLDQVISFSPDGIRLETIRAKLGLVGIERINGLGIFISQRDKKRLLEAAAELLESGVAVEQLAEDLLDYFRNLLLIKNGIRRESLLSFAVGEFSPEVVERFSAAQLEKALELLLELHRGLKFSANPRFDLELVLCQLAGLGDLIPPGELLASLRSLKAAVLAESGAAVGAADAGPGAPSPDAASQGAPVTAAASAAAVPAAAPAAASSPDAPAAAAAAAPVALRPLVDAVRREKLALAASLEKAESMSLERGELRLVYRPKDRYQGVQVSREKEVILRHAATVFGSQNVTRLRVDYAGEDPGAAAPNHQAEMVKKIFRGEVVKGQ